MDSSNFRNFSLRSIKRNVVCTRLKVLNFQKTGQKDSSNYYLKKITEDSPNPASALFRVGVLSRNSKLYTLALHSLKSALKMNEKHKEAWYELGVTYQEISEDSLEQAKSAFWKVIKLDTEHKMAWYSLSLCYMARNEIDNIIDASEKALSLEFDLSPVDLERRIDLSDFRSRYSPGAPRESSTDISYRDAINFILWTSLGYAYSQKARYDKAVTAFSIKKVSPVSFAYKSAIDVVSWSVSFPPSMLPFNSVLMLRPSNLITTRSKLNRLPLINLAISD